MISLRHNFRRTGFTLIELVLALGMVAVVAGSLYASLHAGFNLTQRADAMLEPSRTADLAMELLAADLQNAVTPNTTITNANNIYDLNTLSSSTANTSTSGGIGNGSAASSSANAAPTGWVLAGPFEGTQEQNGTAEADDLIFFTTADAPQHPDANGEIKMVELTLDTPPGTKDVCLVRKVTANLTSEQPLKQDEEILCRGVAGLTLEYFDGSEWETTWDSTQEDNTIPAAVQVTLALDRPQADGQKKTLNYTRVFTLSCSSAALDSNVNSGESAP